MVGRKHVAIITGTSRSETLTGTPSADTIYGRGGKRIGIGHSRGYKKQARQGDSM